MRSPPGWPYTRHSFLTIVLLWCVYLTVTQEELSYSQESAEEEGDVKTDSEEIDDGVEPLSPPELNGGDSTLEEVSLSSEEEESAP